MARLKGVEVDPTKVEAMIKLLTLKNVREIIGFQSSIAYIYKFISNLFGRCQSCSRLM